MLETIGHLAVWPGAYAVGVLGLLVWLQPIQTAAISRRDAWLAAILMFLCAHAGYLLDRAKLADRLLDPSDRASNPSRYGLFANHGHRIRVVAIAELLAGSIVGATLHPPLAAIPPAVAIGVTLYAGRPANSGRPRPKDLRLLKAPMIATAHVALAAAVATAIAGTGSILTPGTLALWMLVAGDAILCDLDDLEADRAYGTRSVPVMFGARVAWAMAIVATAISAVLVWLTRGGLPSLCFALLLAASLFATRLLPKRKDYIDARLMVVAIICMTLD
ncbi:MAG: hypothetical protein AAGA55_07765 [Planctomycetota bacterium]